MTKTRPKYKRIDSYVTKFRGLGECEVRGESLKDGNLIVCTTDIIRGKNMFVIDPSHYCGACGSVNYKVYHPALDGA